MSFGNTGRMICMTTLNESPLRAVSIFTGAGGLDIGFERAGFNIISTLEIHPKYCDTIRLNQSKKIPVTEKNIERTFFGGAKIINADIATVSGDDLTTTKYPIDCLIGGPPCQAFSSAGKQQSIFDKRGILIYEFFRILNEIRPKTFLFENVRGLVTAKGKNAEPGEILNELLSLFSSIGYNCRVALLNAAEYGAYQRRVRCFIIGSSIAAAPFFPNPQFAEKEEISLIPEMNRKRWKTLGEYLNQFADLDESVWIRPSENLAQQLDSIPCGKGLKSAGRIEATRPGGHWGYRQGTFIADLSKPARTVTGSSSQDWIRMRDGTLRRLTLKEVAGLQGFPVEWEFCGSKTDQYQQVGNAVPTVFGQVIGETLAEYIRGGYLSMPKSNKPELPSDIKECIRYTKYDYEKNCAYRANKFPAGS